MPSEDKQVVGRILVEVLCSVAAGGVIGVAIGFTNGFLWVSGNAEFQIAAIIEGAFAAIVGGWVGCIEIPLLYFCLLRRRIDMRSAFKLFMAVFTLGAVTALLSSPSELECISAIVTPLYAWGLSYWFRLPAKEIRGFEVVMGSDGHEK